MRREVRRCRAHDLGARGHLGEVAYAVATPDAAPLFAAALSPQRSRRRSTLVAAAPSPQIMAGGFLTYAATSTALLTAVVYEAVQQRRQFYPTVIYLTTSKVSALVLGNEALVLTLLFGQLCKRFFFGQLRERRSSTCTSARGLRSPRRAWR